jgi:hypothetical protein
MQKDLKKQNIKRKKEINLQLPNQTLQKAIQ